MRPFLALPARLLRHAATSVLAAVLVLGCLSVSRDVTLPERETEEALHAISTSLGPQYAAVSGGLDGDDDLVAVPVDEPSSTTIVIGAAERQPTGVPAPRSARRAQRGARGPPHCA